MDKLSPTEQQREIGAALQVQGQIDPQQAAERCRASLCAQLEASGQQVLVLGISGGVDSTVAGRLAQLAVEKALWNPSRR